MQDPHSHNKYSALISRYLSGNASDAEMQELETWVLAAPENKKRFMAAKKTWMLSGMQQGDQAINVDQLWKQTSDQLFGKPRILELKQRQNRRYWLSIAASVALLIALSVWFFQRPGTEIPMIVNSGSEVKKVELPDGSQITLNQSSSLTYTNVGENARREVSLDGDAFFEVARDETHPFIISTQGIEVEVLGTSFYVDSRKKESAIQVIVESGSVAVRSKGEEAVLKANEKVVFQKQTSQLLKQQNDDANYQSLQTNTLIFKNTKLEEVVFALNRHFSADISIANEAVKKCELTATYTNKSLEAILKIIEETLDIKADQTGRKIVLLGQACK